MVAEPRVATENRHRFSWQLWVVPIVVWLVCWGQMTHGKPTVSGDGPHYLMVTQSLVADGDVDVANNYQSGDGAVFGADGLAPERFVERTPDGRVLPVHDLGLPLLVLPAYRAALAVAPHVPPSLLARFRMPAGLFVYSAVCLFLLTLVSVAWWLTARTLAEYVPIRRAGVIVLLVALAPPLTANASAIFPEGPAMLVVSLVLLKAYGRTRVPDWCVMLAIGGLVWLHRKYMLMAFGLMLWPIVSGRRAGRLSSRQAALSLACGCVPVVALCVWTSLTWGSLGGPLTIGGVPMSWDVFVRGSLGVFFDREYGIVPWAPAALLVPIAWVMAGRDGLLLCLPAVLLYLPAAAHNQWWGGWAPVGRFFVPLAPVVAFVLARQPRWSFPRRLTVALVTVQLAMTAWVWQRPRLLWNAGHGHNKLIEALPYGAYIERAWPSYSTDAQPGTLALVWLAGVVIGTALLAARARRAATLASRPGTASSA